MKFSLSYKDEQIVKLLQLVDIKTAVKWAFLCAENVLPIYERSGNSTKHPRKALQACLLFIDDKLDIEEAREHAFKVHEVARSSTQEIVQSAARSCAHAIATAHVKEHAISASNYALHVFYLLEDEDNLNREREWQIQKLEELKDSIMI